MLFFSPSAASMYNMYDEDEDGDNSNKERLEENARIKEKINSLKNKMVNLSVSKKVTIVLELIVLFVQFVAWNLPVVITSLSRVELLFILLFIGIVSNISCSSCYRRRVSRQYRLQRQTGCRRCTVPRVNLRRLSTGTVVFHLSFHKSPALALSFHSTLQSMTTLNLTNLLPLHLPN